jgi:hypothetical protein
VAGKVDSQGPHALPAAGHPRQTPSGIPIMPSVLSQTIPFKPSHLIATAGACPPAAGRGPLAHHSLWRSSKDLTRSSLGFQARPAGGAHCKSACALLVLHCYLVYVISMLAALGGWCRWLLNAAARVMPFQYV